MYLIKLFFQDTHFNLSSFIERIGNRHNEKDAKIGNGYDINDPFIDDSEYIEVIEHNIQSSNSDISFIII